MHKLKRVYCVTYQSVEKKSHNVQQIAQRCDCGKLKMKFVAL